MISDEFCWNVWDGRGAFNVLGLEIGQQTVILAAILIAVSLFAYWRLVTRGHKYDVWGGIQH
jgi:hypothetical protein